MLVVSAPSGTGKSTLTRRLMQEFPELSFSISCTTRARREGEVDGRDYRFLGVDEFMRMKDQGGFAEWAQVYGNYYGTPKDETSRLLSQGKDLLFDIDVQGAGQLQRNMEGGTYVFIFPPSLGALKDRLLGRGTDKSDSVAKRLETAPGELEQAKLFNYWIVNDDLEQAFLELKSIYLAERCKASRRPGLIDHILNRDA